MHGIQLLRADSSNIATRVCQAFSLCLATRCYSFSQPISVLGYVAVGMLGTQIVGRPIRGGAEADKCCMRQP